MEVVRCFNPRKRSQKLKKEGKKESKKERTKENLSGKRNLSTERLREDLLLHN